MRVFLLGRHVFSRETGAGKALIHPYGGWAAVDRPFRRPCAVVFGPASGFRLSFGGRAATCCVGRPTGTQEGRHAAGRPGRVRAVAAAIRACIPLVTRCVHASACVPPQVLRKALAGRDEPAAINSLGVARQSKTSNRPWHSVLPARLRSRHGGPSATTGPNTIDPAPLMF